MAATDAKPVPQKNVAYRVTFPILDADGDLVTGAASLDSEVSIDGAAFADCTNEATEIATSSGVYYLDLTSSEMNGDTIAVIVKTGTVGAKTTLLVFYPEEAGDIRVNVTQVAGTTQTAGDIIGDTNDIQSRLPAALVSGRMDASVGAMAANVLTASALAADAAAEIADAVWDEDATAHQTQGTFGQAIGDPGADTDTIFGLLNTNLDATVSSRASQASVNTIDDFLDTEVAAILAAVDTEVAAILADTNELQTDLADGGRVDLLIDGIKAKTDSLTFTAAGHVDANIQRINDVIITGNGQVGTEFGV